MKKLFSLILISCGSLALKAQNEKTPYLVKSLANENIKKVQVETSGGSISVTAVSKGDARVEVYVQPNNERSVSTEELQSRLQNYTLDVSVSNNKVIAIAKTKERDMDWRRGLSISFRIFVPENVSTNLATSGGSIYLKGLSGVQEFSTSGGSLHMDSISGKIKGRTSGGSIHIANSKDDIDLLTSGGSIYADNVSGNILLSTSGGTLHLSDLNGTIKATTSGGSIDGRNITGELVTHTSGEVFIL